MKHLDIIIQGKVQSVGFRQAAKAVANQLGVNGTVRNEKDGSVVIEAEAEETLLDLFMDFCHEGSDTSHIIDVQSNEGEVKNYRNFEILKRGL